MKDLLSSLLIHSLIILGIFFFDKSFVDNSKKNLIGNESNLELFEIVSFIKKNKSEFNKISNKRSSLRVPEPSKNNITEKINIPEIRSSLNKVNIPIKNNIIEKINIPKIRSSLTKVNIPIKNNIYMSKINNKTVYQSFRRSNTCKVINTVNSHMQKDSNSLLNYSNQVHINQLLNNNKLWVEKKININQLLNNNKYNSVRAETKININHLLSYQLVNKQSLRCFN